MLASGCRLGFLNPGPRIFERHGSVEKEGLGRGFEIDTKVPLPLELKTGTWCGRGKAWLNHAPVESFKRLRIERMRPVPVGLMPALIREKKRMVKADGGLECL